MLQAFVLPRLNAKVGISQFKYLLSLNRMFVLHQLANCPTVALETGLEQRSDAGIEVIYTGQIQQRCVGNSATSGTKLDWPEVSTIS